MLAVIAHEILALQTSIEVAYEMAEQNGSANLPPEIYANVERIEALRRAAAGCPIKTLEGAIAALQLVAETCGPLETPLLSSVIAFLSPK